VVATNPVDNTLSISLRTKAVNRTKIGEEFQALKSSRSNKTVVCLSRPSRV